MRKKHGETSSKNSLKNPKNKHRKSQRKTKEFAQQNHSSLPLKKHGAEATAKTRLKTTEQKTQYQEPQKSSYKNTVAKPRYEVHSKTKEQNHRSKTQYKSTVIKHSLKTRQQKTRGSAHRFQRLQSLVFIFVYFSKPCGIFPIKHR